MRLSRHAPMADLCTSMCAWERCFGSTDQSCACAMNAGTTRPHSIAANSVSALVRCSQALRAKCPHKIDIGAVFTAPPRDKASLNPAAFRPVQKVTRPNQNACVTSDPPLWYRRKVAAQGTFVVARSALHADRQCVWQMVMQCLQRVPARRQDTVALAHTCTHRSRF